MHLLQLKQQIFGSKSSDTKCEKRQRKLYSITIITAENSEIVAIKRENFSLRY